MNRRLLLTTALAGPYATKILGEHGATRVYVVDNPDLEDFLVAPKADALVAVVKKASPAAVLVTAGREGTEVAARAAVRLDSGIIPGDVDHAERGRPRYADHHRAPQRRGP